MGRSLVDKIEDGALDPKSDLPSLLRQCIALGGRSGSEELRLWARQELNGYIRDEAVPTYRLLPATLHVDGSNLRYQISGQQISPLALPEFARESVTEEQLMTNSIAEIADLVGRLSAQGESAARLSFSGAADLAHYMTAQQGGNPRVERIYKQVSVTALTGVLNAVRTKLVELTAEIRQVGGDVEIPSRDVVDQAVGLVINGERNLVVVNQAAGERIDQQAAGRTATRGKQAPEHWARSLGFWVTVLGTVVSAAAAVYVIWGR